MSFVASFTPSYGISGGDIYSIQEDANAGFLLSFSGYSGSFSYTYSISTGSASFADVGSTSGSGSMSINATYLYTANVPISVSVLGDTVDEATEDFFINVSLSGTSFSDGSTSKSFRIFILDDIARHGTNVDDTISGSINSDTIFGYEGDDFLDGSAGNDLLIGSLGHDRLLGGLGDDTLMGDTDADTMYGGYGSDTFYVDNIADIVVENRRWDGVDLVISSVDFLMGKQHIENLTLSDTGNIRGIGNGLENVIIGNSGDNLIDGGPRNDVMTGGAGNDTYFVRDAGDQVNEAADEGLDSVRAFINYELTAEVEKLYIQGTVALNGRGNALNNIIVGNNAANVINGREGSDILTGQGGADSFVFDRAASTANADRITDFQVDTDRLLFARSAYAGFAAGTFQASALAYGTAALDADDRLVYDGATGRLWYDADGSGTGAQELVAVLTNRAAIDAGDIFLA